MPYDPGTQNTPIDISTAPLHVPEDPTMTEATTGCPFHDGRVVYDYSPGDAEHVADPRPFLAKARAETPLFYSPRHDGFWTLTRYADVYAATRDGDRFSSAVVGVTMPEKVYAREHPYIPVETDDPEHNEYRSIIAPLLTRSAVKRLEPAIVEIVDEQLASFEGRDRADLVQEFALPMVSRVLMLAMGMPAEDAPSVVDVTMRMFHGRINDKAAAATATAEFDAYLRKNIEAYKAGEVQGDSIFSRMVAARLKDGRALVDWELHMFAANIFIAGFETTINAIGSALWWLSRDLETRRRIASEPEVIDTAIEEFLRYFTPVQIFGRNAKTDIELLGQPIAEGEGIFLHYGSANRDSATFTTADEIDIDRAPNRHLAFGSGIHFCMGAQLARLEIKVALQHVLARFPDYTPAPDAEPEWTPSADQRGLWRLPVLLQATGGRS
ncbi:MAG: hypothetical protein ABS81_06475 [Pseudonocardia sp. SCN 72-86]|nr:MAG: hypothetical protein ABS81_06475 [Pseudonocardia sp. SCN 72-86]